MPSFPRQLAIIPALTMLALLAGGIFLYRDERRSLWEETEKDLRAIAQLKIAQIVNWRSERLADAALIMEPPFFRRLAAEWIVSPDPGEEAELRERFESLRTHHAYHDIWLVDAAGRRLFSLTGEDVVLVPESGGTLEEAIRNGVPAFASLRMDSSGLPHLGVIAPLRSPDGGTRFVGAMVLRWDARRFLYPLIQSWPTASQSAETLLVRKDGDEVLFLNELRHRKNTALRLRFPLTQWDLPAAMVVDGREGLVQGVDYRGVEVLAVLGAIPDSPWRMVAKVDQEEALAIWHRHSIFIVGFLMGLVMTVLAMALVAWHRHNATHYRRLFLAEEAQRRSEKRYGVTLMSVGDGVITTDVQGRVELMNPVAEKLTGWTIAEAKGRPLEEVFRIVHEMTRETVENPVREVIRRGAIVGLANHTLLIARDGVERPIADSGAPIRDESGIVFGVVLVFRDQTQERAAEAEREKLRERLLQARKMESVGRLAGGVAHDFNNMLQVILGYADLAIEAADPGGDLRRHLMEIRNSARRSADLTRQLLAFARKQIVSPKPLDLNETLVGMLDALRRIVGEDIQVIWQPGPGLWRVWIDPAQVEQLLMNLAANAREAITGAGTVTIATENVSEEVRCPETEECRKGDFVALTLGDTGRGMDPETLNHLFEPFFSTKEQGKGTGLGLATVYGITRQNGGFISVDSAPGQGTEIRILLPRFVETSREKFTEPSRDQSEKPSAVTSFRGRETILVVEDEEAILSMLARLLGSLGYTILMAGTPARALELANDHPGEIGLLITDVVMPDMNGRELAGRIRAIRPGIRCLLISGYTAEAIAQYGVMEEGMYFLRKPFSVRVLAETTRGILGGREVPEIPAALPSAQ